MLYQSLRSVSDNRVRPPGGRLGEGDPPLQHAQQATAADQKADELTHMISANNALIGKRAQPLGFT